MVVPKDSMPRDQAKTVRFRRAGREILSGLAISVGTLAMLALVGEALIRWRAQGIDPQWTTRLHPVGGMTYAPDEMVSWTNHVDFWTRQIANREGFLDRDPDEDADAAGCRIVLVGDSFVEASQVKLKDKVQVRLEGLLRAAVPELRPRVWAYGFSGTGQASQIGFYEAFARRHRPDVVVLFLVINDFCDNSAVLTAVRNGWDPVASPRSLAVYDPFRGDYVLTPVSQDWQARKLPQPPSIPGNRFARLLYAKSRLYRWLAPHLAKTFALSLHVFSGEDHPSGDQTPENARHLRDHPEYARYFGQGETPPELTFSRLDMEYLRPDLPVFFEEGIRATAFALDCWVELSRRDGFELVAFVTHCLGGAARDRFTALLSQRGIPFVEQNEYLRRSDTSVEEIIFQYDAHWNATGHRVAAEALADFLRKHLGGTILRAGEGRG